MSSTTTDHDYVIHLAIELSCSTWLVAARIVTAWLTAAAPRVRRCTRLARRRLVARLATAPTLVGSRRCASKVAAVRLFNS